MKKGTRSADYDAEGQIPIPWEDNFQTVLKSMAVRNHLSEKIKLLYEESQDFHKDAVEGILQSGIDLFEKLSGLRFFEIAEHLVAQEAMLVVYGYKICANIYPHLKSREQGAMFFKFYGALQSDFLGLNETLKNKFDFWHQYAFKIGLHSLNLSLLVKEKCFVETFKVDDDFKILHRTSPSDNFSGKGTSPIDIIAQYISNDGIRLDTNYGNLPYVLVIEKVKAIIKESK